VRQKFETVSNLYIFWQSWVKISGQSDKVFVLVVKVLLALFSTIASHLGSWHLQNSERRSSNVSKIACHRELDTLPQKSASSQGFSKDHLTFQLTLLNLTSWE